MARGIPGLKVNTGFRCHCRHALTALRRAQRSTLIDGTVHLSLALIQTVAGDDVASAVGRIAVGRIAGRHQRSCRSGSVRAGRAGPHRRNFKANPRPVVTDAAARYFGALLATDTLLPSDSVTTFPTRLQNWLEAAVLDKMM